MNKKFVLPKKDLEYMINSLKEEYLHFYTHGASATKTGLEDKSLQYINDLLIKSREKLTKIPILQSYQSYFDYIFSESDIELKEAETIRKDSKTLASCIQEIHNRFIQRLSTPAVMVNDEMFFGSIMSSIKKPIINNEIKQNVFISYNTIELAKLNMYSILHETKHISQFYSVERILKHNSFKNNEFIEAFANLATRIFKALPNLNLAYNYDTDICEIDANIFAGNMIRKLENSKVIKFSDEDKVLNGSFNYLILKKLKYKNGIDKNIRKELSEYFETTKQLFLNNDFGSEFKNITENIEKINFDKYLDYIDNSLRETYNETKLLLMELKKAGYGDSFLDENNEIIYKENGYINLQYALSYFYDVNLYNENFDTMEDVEVLTK